jgi:hypothetical protein
MSYQQMTRLDLDRADVALFRIWSSLDPGGTASPDTPRAAGTDRAYKRKQQLVEPPDGRSDRDFFLASPVGPYQGFP